MINTLWHHYLSLPQRTLASSDATFTFNVVALSAPVTITTASVAYGTRGQPYRWTVIAGALPGGLSLDRNTGLISGTPATVETFNFTVAVTDLNGSSASKLFKTLVR
jgi:hypothetical protein